jgi:hypothetical protein
LLDKELKEKTTPRIREYLRQHQDCKYEDLIKDLGLKNLSKPWFYALRSESKKKAGEVNAPVHNLAFTKLEFVARPPSLMTLEILESIDSTGFSEELHGFYKTHVLPLLKRLLPGGSSLQMVFLTDPSRIEIRKLIT